MEWVLEGMGCWMEALACSVTAMGREGVKKADCTAPRYCLDKLRCSRASTTPHVGVLDDVS
jgi:hypothetical protein